MLLHDLPVAANGTDRPRPQDATPPADESRTLEWWSELIDAPADDTTELDPDAPSEPGPVNQV